MVLQLAWMSIVCGTSWQSINLNWQPVTTNMTYFWSSCHHGRMSLTHSVWSPAHQQLAQHPTMASSLLNQGEALPWMRSWRDGNPTTTTSQDPWSQGCMTRPCWSRAWRMQTRDFALHLWPFRSCRGSPRAEHSASSRGASSCNPVARSASSTTATLEARVPGLPTTTSWCCAVLCDRRNTSQWLQHPWLGRHGTPVLSTIISRVEERIGPMPTGTHQFQRLNPFAAWFASGTQPGVHQHSKSTTPSSLDCRLQLRLSIATPDWLRLWGGDCSGAWPVSTLMTPTSLTGVPQKGMDSTVSNSSMPCWEPHSQPKSDKRCRQKVFSWGFTTTCSMSDTALWPFGLANVWLRRCRPLCWTRWLPHNWHRAQLARSMAWWTSWSRASTAG